MKTKNIFLLAICIACTLNCYSQNWLWAKSSVGTGSDEGTSVSADRRGNVFVTGTFSSPTITFGTTTLTNVGSIFIAKYDINGNVLWAKSAAGPRNNESWSVSADASGNVFVTGAFSGSTITFGSTTLYQVGWGNTNVFIAKYDVNGNVLWAKSATGAGYQEGNSISADAAGNVFVTGSFSGPSISFGSTTLSNVGGVNVFIAKYDANGNVLWAKNVGDYGAGNSVSADAGGNVFITGWFSSPTITFGSTTLINVGNYNVFIAKYDANGNVLWAKSAAGIGNDQGYSISADAAGNAFVTGFFQSPTITFGSTTLTNAGIVNDFIVKYDANGNVLWAQRVGGTGADFGYSVSADAGGDVFATGSFNSSTITFGSITLIPPAGSTDPMFIVKYDANGNVLCASALASGGFDKNTVSADPFGNAYIGGDFIANPFIVGSDTLPLTGGENVFVAKYTCKHPSTTTAINELTNEESVSVYPNPTNGMFNVQCLMANGNTSTINHQPLTIEVYNVFGETIYSTTVNSKQATSLIDISDSPNGIYFVHIISENGSAVKKIIIQK